MTKPGRPSLEEEDRPALVYMAELWCAGNSGYSIRHLSRIAAGIDLISPHGFPPTPPLFSANRKGNPESIAKGYERRFLQLNRDKMAIPISVYRVLHQERHIAMKAGNRPDPRTTTAKRCGITENEVDIQATRGLEILRDWFPREYPETL